jgi:hypothetical protein
MIIFEIKIAYVSNLTHPWYELTKSIGGLFILFLRLILLSSQVLS